MKRAGMQPGQKPFHNESRTQIQSGNVPNYFWSQILFGRRHAPQCANFQLQSPDNSDSEAMYLNQATYNVAFENQKSPHS
jgi:hypothetical protein